MSGAYGEYTAHDGVGKKLQPLFRDYIETNAVRELLFYRTVRHPNLMRAIQCRVGRQLDIRMDAADTDLSNWIHRSGKRVRMHHSHTIITGITRALEFMHGHGMAHGDLKLSNVVVNFGHRIRVRLIDFGTVQWLSELDGQTRYRRAMTTFWYVAPEDALHDVQGPAADMWALGLIMLTYWTGETPFRFKSYMQARAWFKKNTDVLSAINYDKIHTWMPRHIYTLIGRLLDPNPETRATASEVLQALGSTPVPGTLRDIPRTHDALVERLVKKTRRREIDLECAREVARSIFDPWHDFVLIPGALPAVISMLRSFR